MEEKLRRQEMEMDYLAPFLAQIGSPEKINKSQAFKLKEDCLADLKQRLIDKANLIQLRFEKVRNKFCISGGAKMLKHRLFTRFSRAELLLGRVSRSDLD